MTLFDYGERLAPLRTGRWAEVFSSLAWFTGIFVTVAHPVGLVLGGALLGLTATSVRRAFAAGMAFGITLVAAGTVWLLVVGPLPVSPSVPVTLVAFLSLLVPPVVAAVVRFIG